MTLEDVVMNARYQMACDGILDQNETCDRIFASAGPNYIYNQDSKLSDTLYGSAAKLPEQTNWDDIRNAINAIRKEIGRQRLGSNVFSSGTIDVSWLNCTSATADAKQIFPFLYDMYRVCMSAQKYAYVEGYALEYVIRTAINGNLPDEKLARDLRRIISVMRNSDDMLRKDNMRRVASGLAAIYQDVTGKYPLYYCETTNPVNTGVRGIYQNEIAMTVVIETDSGNFRYHSYALWSVDYAYTSIWDINTRKDLMKYKCRTSKMVKDYLDKTWK